MIYKVQYGQTIYDVILNTYGRFEYVLKLIAENPFIDSVDYDFDANPGAEISWDSTFIIPQPPEMDRNSTANSELSASIIATNGQSIYDLCLMTYGDLKYVYKLMTDNNIVSLNDTNLSGKKIIFNPTLKRDVVFYNFLLTKKKVINTLDNTKTGKSYNKSFNISFH